MWDNDTVREVKESKSNEEGVDADDVDLALEGKRMDDNHQWQQTNVFDDADFRWIYMYRR